MRSGNPEADREEISREVLSARGGDEDISRIRVLGFGVDGDNEVAPQNIPTRAENNEHSPESEERSPPRNGCQISATSAQDPVNVAANPPAVPTNIPAMTPARRGTSLMTSGVR